MLKVIKRVGKFHAICECVECGSHYETNYYGARKSRIGHLCKLCKCPSGQELNQALLQKFYSYDPNTGLLTCKLPQQQHYIGDVIGSLSNHGYLEAGIGNKSYLVHRLIWLYMTGYFPEKVDHINHDRLDNRWNNLREVDNTENSKNCSVSRNSRTGVNGVSYMKTKGKYRAYVTVNRKQVYVGLYDSIDEAIAARAKADQDYKFHSNHGTRG